MVNQQNFRKNVLTVAQRHLSYILTDEKLGLNSRNYNKKRALEFYASALTAAGMPEAIQDLYDLESKAKVSVASSKYKLQNVFHVLGIKDNVTIFEVLEFTSSQVERRNSPRGMEFMVNENAVEKIIDFLNKKSKMDYTNLGGSGK